MSTSFLGDAKQTLLVLQNRQGFVSSGALCQPLLELQLCIVRSTSRQCSGSKEALLSKVLFDKL